MTDILKTGLRKRVKEVLAMLSQGLTAKEVSLALRLPLRTVYRDAKRVSKNVKTKPSVN